MDSNFWAEIDSAAFFQNNVLREVVASGIFASILLNMNIRAFTTEMFRYVVLSIAASNRKRIPRIHFSQVSQEDPEFREIQMDLRVPFLQRVSAGGHATLLCGDGKGNVIYFDSNGTETTSATEEYANRFAEFVAAKRGDFQKILTGRLQTEPVCATWVVCLATIVVCCNFDFSAVRERIQDSIPLKDVIGFAFTETCVIARSREPEFIETFFGQIDLLDEVFDEFASNSLSGVFKKLFALTSKVRSIEDLTRQVLEGAAEEIRGDFTLVVESDKIFVTGLPSSLARDAPTRSVSQADFGFFFSPFTIKLTLEAVLIAAFSFHSKLIKNLAKRDLNFFKEITLLWIAVGEANTLKGEINFEKLQSTTFEDLTILEVKTISEHLLESKVIPDSLFAIKGDGIVLFDTTTLSCAAHLELQQIHIARNRRLVREFESTA